MEQRLAALFTSVGNALDSNTYTYSDSDYLVRKILVKFLEDENALLASARHIPDPEQVVEAILNYVISTEFANDDPASWYRKAMAITVEFADFAHRNDMSENSARYAALLPEGHPRVKRVLPVTASAARNALADWMAADPRLDVEAAEQVRKLYSLDESADDLEAEFETLKAEALVAAGRMPEELLPIVAAFNLSFAQRSAISKALAAVRRRDRKGRFAREFGRLKLFFKSRGQFFSSSPRIVGPGRGENTYQVESKGDPNIPDGIYEVDAALGENIRAYLPKSAVKGLSSRKEVVAEDDKRFAIELDDFLQTKQDAPNNWTKSGNKFVTKDGKFTATKIDSAEAQKFLDKAKERGDEPIISGTGAGDAFDPADPDSFLITDSKGRTKGVAQDWAGVQEVSIASGATLLPEQYETMPDPRPVPGIAPNSPKGQFIPGEIVPNNYKPDYRPIVRDPFDGSTKKGIDFGPETSLSPEDIVNGKIDKNFDKNWQAWAKENDIEESKAIDGTDYSARKRNRERAARQRALEKSLGRMLDDNELKALDLKRESESVVDSAKKSPKLYDIPELSGKKRTETKEDKIRKALREELFRKGKTADPRFDSMRKKESEPDLGQAQEFDKSQLSPELIGEGYNFSKDGEGSWRKDGHGDNGETYTVEQTKNGDWVVGEISGSDPFAESKDLQKFDNALEAFEYANDLGTNPSEFDEEWVNELLSDQESSPNLDQGQSVDSRNKMDRSAFSKEDLEKHSDKLDELDQAIFNNDRQKLQTLREKYALDQDVSDDAFAEFDLAYSFWANRDAQVENAIYRGERSEIDEMLNSPEYAGWKDRLQDAMDELSPDYDLNQDSAPILSEKQLEQATGKQYAMLNEFLEERDLDPATEQALKDAIENKNLNKAQASALIALGRNSDFKEGVDPTKPSDRMLKSLQGYLATKDLTPSEVDSTLKSLAADSSRDNVEALLNKLRRKKDKPVDLNQGTGSLINLGDGNYDWNDSYNYVSVFKTPSEWKVYYTNPSISDRGDVTDHSRSFKTEEEALAFGEELVRENQEDGGYSRAEDDIVTMADMINLDQGQRVKPTSMEDAATDKQYGFLESLLNGKKIDDPNLEAAARTAVQDKNLTKGEVGAFIGVLRNLPDRPGARREPSPKQIASIRRAVIERDLSPEERKDLSDKLDSGISFEEASEMLNDLKSRSITSEGMDNLLDNMLTNEDLDGLKYLLSKPEYNEYRDAIADTITTLRQSTGIEFDPDLDIDLNQGRSQQDLDWIDFGSGYIKEGTYTSPDGRVEVSAERDRSYTGTDDEPKLVSVKVDGVEVDNFRVDRDTNFDVEETIRESLSGLQEGPNYSEDSINSAIRDALAKGSGFNDEPSAEDSIEINLGNGDTLILSNSMDAEGTSEGDRSSTWSSAYIRPANSRELIELAEFNEPNGWESKEVKNALDNYYNKSEGPNLNQGQDKDGSLQQDLDWIDTQIIDEDGNIKLGEYESPSGAVRLIIKRDESSDDPTRISIETEYSGEYGSGSVIRKYSPRDSYSLGKMLKSDIQDMYFDDVDDATLEARRDNLEAQQEGPNLNQGQSSVSSQDLADDISDKLNESGYPNKDVVSDTYNSFNLNSNVGVAAEFLSDMRNLANDRDISPELSASISDLADRMELEMADRFGIAEAARFDNNSDSIDLDDVRDAVELEREMFFETDADKIESLLSSENSYGDTRSGGAEIFVYQEDDGSWNATVTYGDGSSDEFKGENKFDVTPEAAAAAAEYNRTSVPDAYLGETIDNLRKESEDARSPEAAEKFANKLDSIADALDNNRGDSDLAESLREYGDRMRTLAKKRQDDLESQTPNEPTTSETQEEMATDPDVNPAGYAEDVSDDLFSQMKPTEGPSGVPEEESFLSKDGRVEVTINPEGGSYTVYVDGQPVASGDGDSFDIAESTQRAVENYFAKKA